MVLLGEVLLDLQDARAAAWLRRGAQRGAPRAMLNYGHYLLAQDGPMTRSEAGNADGFSYLPGRFFACAVRARAALYYSHDWVASVLSLAGVDAPAAGAPVLYAHAVGGRAQDACAARAWRHEKRSAETAARWLRARGRAAAADRARAACYAARRPSRDYQNR